MRTRIPYDSVQGPSVSYEQIAEPVRGDDLDLLLGQPELLDELLEASWFLTPFTRVKLTLEPLRLFEIGDNRRPDLGASGRM